MITAKIETITPDIAREYLTHNTDNYRPYSRQKASAYAMDIKNGNWQLNGEAITFRNNGVLANGQHRLNAVIMAGLPITSLVVYGVDDDVVAYDIGKSRTLPEIARASGLDKKVANNVVMAVATMFASSQDRFASPKETIVEYAKKHGDELAEAHRVAKLGASKALCDKSPIIAMAYVCIRARDYRVDTMEDFFTIVNSGFSINDRECSPAIVFRNMLIKMGTHGGLSKDEVKRLFGNALLALDDFAKNRKRRQKYEANTNYYDIAHQLVIDLDSNKINTEEESA